MHPKDKLTVRVSLTCKYRPKSTNYIDVKLKVPSSITGHAIYGRSGSVNVNAEDAHKKNTIIIGPTLIISGKVRFVLVSKEIYIF